MRKGYVSHPFLSPVYFLVGKFDRHEKFVKLVIRKKHFRRQIRITRTVIIFTLDKAPKYILLSVILHFFFFFLLMALLHDSKRRYGDALAVDIIPFKRGRLFFFCTIIVSSVRSLSNKNS